LFKRVLLKISGEALSSETSVLCSNKIKATATTLASLQARGFELGIVVGGGNILRGRNASNMERNRADHIGMLATVINSLTLQDTLEQLGAPCVVLSAVDMPRFCDSYTSRHAKLCLAEGKIVVFACGSGCPYFSTDTAAALRAAEIDAEVLLLAKNVDAIYSDDPKRNPNAKRYDHINYQKIIQDNLNALDITAVTLCSEQDIPIHVFALSEILPVFSGEHVGTRIDACS